MDFKQERAYEQYLSIFIALSNAHYENSHTHLDKTEYNKLKWSKMSYFYLKCLEIFDNEDKFRQMSGYSLQGFATVEKRKVKGKRFKQKVTVTQGRWIRHKRIHQMQFSIRPEYIRFTTV